MSRKTKGTKTFGTGWAVVGVLPGCRLSSTFKPGPAASCERWRNLKTPMVSHLLNKDLGHSRHDTEGGGARPRDLLPLELGQPWKQVNGADYRPCHWGNPGPNWVRLAPDKSGTF